VGREMKSPNKITGANAGGPHQLAIRTRRAARVAQFYRWAKVRLGIFALLCFSGLIVGCSRDGYVRGRGDIRQFIMGRALTFGGRPIATNALPPISGEWEYGEDEFGVGFRLPLSSFGQVESFLTTAFGPQSNGPGWRALDVGVGIYLLKDSGNTLFSIHPPMSDEKAARMWNKIADVIEQNTK
jgi:hypothetical protein